MTEEDEISSLPSCSRSTQQVVEDMQVHFSLGVLDCSEKARLLPFTSTLRVAGTYFTDIEQKYK